MPDGSGRRIHKYEYSYTAQGVELSEFVDVTPYYYPLMQPLPQAGFHTHEWYELFFIERGLMNCYFERETISVRARELLIVRPGIRHYSQGQTEEMVGYAVPFSFTAKKNCRTSWIRFLNFASHALIPADKECAALAEFLVGALKTERELAVGSYLFALLTRMADLSTECAEGENALLCDSFMGRICRIDRILQKYFNNSNLTMKFVADELPVSGRQLSRIIQKQYGCTYREKLLSLRMQYALKLLGRGVSVSQTAYEVGYSSVSAFHAAFVKYYGETPSVYSKKESDGRK